MLFLTQMARETVETFPAIPGGFNMNPSRKNIAQKRREMAEDILLASGTLLIVLIK